MHILHHELLHQMGAYVPYKKLKGESVPLYDNKRTVFVGNLPFDVKDEELYQLFCGIFNRKLRLSHAKADTTR